VRQYTGFLPLRNRRLFVFNDFLKIIGQLIRVDRENGQILPPNSMDSGVVAPQHRIASSMGRGVCQWNDLICFDKIHGDT